MGIIQSIHCEDKAQMTEKRGTGLREILEKDWYVSSQWGDMGPWEPKLVLGVMV